MKKARFLVTFGFLLIAAAFSVAVMLLWNWLMPAIFGLTTINFWQALGLFILARILVGGFGFREKMMRHAMHHHHEQNDIREKWMNMTSEQRKEFIRKRRQFGFGHPPFGHDFFDMEEHKEHEKENE